jgi:hypothetical protein
MCLALVVAAKRNVHHFMVLLFDTIEFRKAASVMSDWPSPIAALVDLVSFNNTVPSQEANP